MTRILTAARALLWLMAAYHLLAGFLLLWSGDATIWAAKRFMGWTVPGSPEMGILGEILGCYMAAFGVMLALAARDPVRNRSLLTVALVLIGLRLLQRLLFGAKVMEVFQVAPGPHWSFFAFVLLLGALLLAVRWQVREPA